MNYKFKQLNSTTCEYFIPIENAKLEHEINELIKGTATNINLKGFRKGKTPKSVIKKRYGYAIEIEALENTVREMSNSLLSALNEEEAKVGWCGSPVIDIGGEEENREYSFTLRVEKLPVVALPPLSEITVTKPVCKLTPAQVETQIYEARIKCIDWYALDDPEAEISMGDRVKLSWSVYFGEEDEESENQTIRRGTEVEMLDTEDESGKPIQQALLGHKCGDIIEVSWKDLIAGASESVIQNRDAYPTVSVTVDAIEIGDLPQLDYWTIQSPRFSKLLGLSGTWIESGFASEYLKSSNETIENDIGDYVFERSLIECLSPSDLTLPRESIRAKFRELLGNMQLDLSPEEKNHYVNVTFDQLADDLEITPWDQEDENADESDNTLDEKNTDHPETDVEQESRVIEETAEDTGRPVDNDTETVSGESTSTLAPNDDDSNDESDEGRRAVQNMVRQIRTNQAKLLTKSVYAESVSRFIYGLVNQKLRQERDIDEDPEWVGKKISQLSRETLGDEQPTEEFLEQLYSEETYQLYATQDIYEKVKNVVLDEIQTKLKVYSIEDYSSEIRRHPGSPMRPAIEDLVMERFKLDKRADLDDSSAVTSEASDSNADSDGGAMNESDDGNENLEVEIEPAGAEIESGDAPVATTKRSSLLNRIFGKK